MRTRKHRHHYLNVKTFATVRPATCTMKWGVVCHWQLCYSSFHNNCWGALSFTQKRLRRVLPWPGRDRASRLQLFFFFISFLRRTSSNHPGTSLMCLSMSHLDELHGPVAFRGMPLQCRFFGRVGLLLHFTTLDLWFYCPLGSWCDGL